MMIEELNLSKKEAKQMSTSEIKREYCALQAECFKERINAMLNFLVSNFVQFETLTVLSELGLYATDKIDILI